MGKGSLNAIINLTEHNTCNYCLQHGKVLTTNHFQILTMMCEQCVSFILSTTHEVQVSAFAVIPVQLQTLYRLKNRVGDGDDRSQQH